MEKYFLQQNILGGFDLVCAKTGKTLKNNVDPKDYKFIGGTNFVTDKDNQHGK
jgi:hypothetical protein